MKKQAFTDKRAFDTLTDKKDSFSIEDREGKMVELSISRPQLGRLAMISQRLLDIDLVFDNEHIEDAVKRMWTICAEKPREVAEIIAIATLRTKQDLDDKLEERTDLIFWSPTMDATAYTNLLHAIVFQSYCEDFMKAIRSVKTLRIEISPTTTAERIATTEEGVSGAK